MIANWGSRWRVTCRARSAHSVAHALGKSWMMR